MSRAHARQGVRWMLIGVLLTVVLIAVFSKRINVFVQEGRLPVLSRPAASILQVFAPASDLWGPLQEAELVLQPGSFVEFDVSHKYLGPYSLKVALAAEETDCQDEWFGWSGEIRMSASDSRAIEQEFDLRTRPHQCYWARDETGVILLFYDAPRDLPLQSPVQVYVAVDEVNEELLGTTVRVRPAKTSHW